MTHDTWVSGSGLCTYRRAKLLTHTPAHMSRALLMSVKSTCQSTVAFVNATMVSLVSSKLLKPAYCTPMSTSKYVPGIWWCVQLNCIYISAVWSPYMVDGIRTLCITFGSVGAWGTVRYQKSSINRLQ